MKTLAHRECEQEIRARLERLRPEMPRRWGRMTAGQMVRHLHDAYLGAMGERAMEMPKGFSLWRLTKPIALYVPMQWPQGVPTRPEFDQQIGGTPPGEFAADVRALLAAVERFAARRFSLQRHPLFGWMTEWEWMRWGYLHADHHLRQFGV